MEACTTSMNLVDASEDCGSFQLKLQRQRLWKLPRLSWKLVGACRSFSGRGKLQRPWKSSSEALVYIHTTSRAGDLPISVFLSLTARAVRCLLPQTRLQNRPKRGQRVGMISPQAVWTSPRCAHNHGRVV